MDIFFSDYSMHRLLCLILFFALFTITWANTVGENITALADKHSQSYFGMCVIAKDEPDIEEWIIYHHKLVRKFPLKILLLCCLDMICYN